MSKRSKKSGHKSDPAAPLPAPAASHAAPSPSPGTAAAATTADPEASWLDSADPRRRLFGKVMLAAVWLYVAALWLLALDQTFNWGIFGPKVPVLP